MSQLPEQFKQNIIQLLGEQEASLFFDAITESPSVSVRYNSKIAPLSNLQQVAWCPDAYYLDERPQFTLDTRFHSGGYYVQEASSMFLWQALSQYVERDAVVFDTCAAPGGKSTLIASYLSQNGMLVSNEFVSQRAHILTENMQKWGRDNCVVSNNSVEHFEQFPELFDAVCVDAPCSGEGMFRKDEVAINEWSPANVEKCVERQRDILSSAWTTLKPGGVLIYSTCTYNRDENEDNVNWLIDTFDAEYLTINLNPDWNITETERGYRFLPHKTRGEGLFLAVVRKSDAPLRKSKTKPPKQLPAKADELLKWIVSDEYKYKTIIHKDIVYAIQSQRYELLVQMLSKLNIMTFGIPLAQQKGRDYIPQTALAMSLYINRSHFYLQEVDRLTALSFLRTETINLPDAPRGFVLITHEDIPLGWVKNVGNRCNNLYPSPWRIRMQVK